MRVCTRNTMKAFKTGTEKTISVRDSVTTEGNVTSWRLWGHAIARRDEEEHKMLLTDCGYSTVTTAERLTAILQEYNAKDRQGNNIRYGTSKGFYTMFRRPNKKDPSKMVWDYKTVNPSAIVIDSVTGTLTE